MVKMDNNTFILVLISFAIFAAAFAAMMTGGF
jgi:hypothetical protein